ncbi:YecA family protein [Ammoniphilus resinae]|uniref:SEC-C motif-containing protein n=1 Tax=Ammoniphilus resinae TaxID=861532 RepID=A0ABS4GWV0_9BACL|nr:SEC-C domain-containing protein [Ammoniphilus resinae]MBP1934721.1 hypothetical protein [Ammoniphilus resinae]
MMIGRNDPCFCGSGRKYKVCCLKKEKIVELRQLQTDRFFDLKHSLTTKMLDFLRSHLDHQEIVAARLLFKQVHQYEKSSRVKQYYDNFWLCFYVRFANGLRGVEWFYQQSKQQLAPNELELLVRWVQLKPKLLQATGPQPTGITVTDLITEENFFLPYCESLKNAFPWGILIALLEPFGEHYCIHGVATFHHPRLASELSDMIQSKIRETGKSYPEVVQDHYLDLMEHTLKESVSKQELTGRREEFTLIYHVHDFERTILFLQDQNQGIYVDNADQKNIQFSWTDTWYEYKDSLFPGAVQVSNVLASIEVNEQELTLTTVYPEIIDTFIQTANRFPLILKYKEQRTKVVPIPANTMITTTSVQLEREDTPSWLPLYAQQLMQMKNRLDNKEVERNNLAELEIWLREAEYSMMIFANDQYPSVGHPFNPNPIRRELGLADSPFVPHGRESFFTVVEGEGLHINVLPQDEIPYYQNIGLTPETAYTFYAADLVEFYKEKTVGKSDATIKKYQKGLQILVQHFHALGEEAPESWDEVNQTFWTTLLNDAHFAILRDFRSSHAKAFQSVLRQLLKWLEQQGVCCLPNIGDSL